VIDRYYDQAAKLYRYFYADWERSVLWQANQLDSLIKEFWGADVKTILDAACGIGTQSLGLAQLGYRVSGSTISGAEIGEARAEAERRDLDIAFEVADMREVSRVHSGPFDVVIACDNAIPHLLSEQDILAAFQEFSQVLRAGGGCLISVRNYENTPRAGQTLLPRHVHELEEGRLVLFDVWDHEGEFYDFTTYIIRDRIEGPAETTVLRNRYFAVALEKLEHLFNQAGFRDVRTLHDRFFQPILIGTKA
jgi:SAM-dependent methyltransferase